MKSRRNIYQPNLSSSDDSDHEANETCVSYTGKKSHSIAAVSPVQMMPGGSLGAKVKRKGWSKPDSEGWSHKKPTRGAKDKKEYTDQQLKQFARIYTDDVKALTAFEMDNFQLTRSSQKYVSMFNFARARDRVLATMFERPPCIWDLHAGSGADSFAFLADLNPKEVVICQRSVPDGTHHGPRFDESKAEYEVMCSNIKSFVRAAGIDALISIEGDSQAATRPHHVHIKCKHKLAENFIMTVPDNTEVDIVHLDPSWDDDHDVGEKVMYGREMTPNELFSRLDHLIWKPIEKKGIKVGCYVIKTRWNLLKVEQYLQAVNSQFIATYSVRAKPFRPNLDGIKADAYEGSKGAYYYMILTHREYKTIDVVPSQMYWDIVRNGTTVWVKRDTCVGLIKPAYSNHKQYPVWTDKDPKDPAYMEIRPHSRPRRGAAKAEGPHNPEEHTTYDPRKYHTGEEPEQEASESSEAEDRGRYAAPNPFGALERESESE